MPRTYVRKSNKASWSQETLRTALNAIEGGRSLKEVSRSFGIPRSTLQDRRKNNNCSKPRLGRKPVFSEAAENEIVEQIVTLSKMFFGATPKTIRECAFNYAKINNLRNPFTEGKLAGRDWLEGFTKRHPEISLRKPESTSLNRVTAFNKEEVRLFFNNLNTMMDKHSFPPTRIFNVDETGITTVQRPSKIFAKKGEKRVGSLTSWERGKTTTVVCAISASGIYIPPMFIYARKRMAQQLQRNGPPGAVYFCSNNGWITEELFLEWLKHFQNSVKPSENDPVLLLLDNHSSHCSFNAYNFCRANNISMVTIPPHTSHRTQPLDVTFYGPLKSAYNAECDKHMRCNPGEKISPYEVAELFNKAFARVATIEKASKGFQVTGIYPVNPDVFTEDDWAPSENLLPTIIGDVEETENVDHTNARAARNLEETTPPKTAQLPNEEKNRNVSFKEILPIPGCSKSTKQNSRKQHSLIFTATPMKDVLEEKENDKQKKVLKTKNTKRQVFSESGNSKKANVAEESFTARKKLKRVSTQNIDYCNKDDAVELSDEDEVNEDICIICGEFGKDRETWYRCTVCGRWAHKACTSTQRKMFVCDFCI